jgi:hypothetical protein
LNGREGSGHLRSDALPSWVGREPDAEQCSALLTARWFQPVQVVDFPRLREGKFHRSRRRERRPDSGNVRDAGGTRPYHANGDEDPSLRKWMISRIWRQENSAEANEENGGRLAEMSGTRVQRVPTTPMENNKRALCKWLISRISECGIRSAKCGMSPRVWAAWGRFRFRLEARGVRRGEGWPS